MWKSSFLNYIIIACIVIICLKIYSESEVYNLKCIISDVNGKRYCVRDRIDTQEAVDLLAKITDKCHEVVKYVE